MDVLVRKLVSFADLEAGDVAALHALDARLEHVPRNWDLFRDGDHPEVIYLVLEGWACRHKMARSGKRQNVASLIPGDLSDYHVSTPRRMDHSLGFLSDGVVARILRQDMLNLIEERPNVSRALHLAALVDEAILRQWLANMALLNAYQRIAFFYCETLQRFQKVGFGEQNAFSVPITQEHLGDNLGLTPVHVNRTLAQLRADGLIELKGQLVTIPDVPRLERAAQFNPAYLRIEQQA